MNTGFGSPGRFTSDARQRVPTKVRLAALNRRDFLKTAGAATLSALAAGYPRALLAATEEKIKPTADTVIVLWMAGGMAHTETFDPKRYTPYETGLESNAVLSTFRSIPTAIDG